MTDLDRPYGGEHRAEARPPMPYFPASPAPAQQQQQQQQAQTGAQQAVQQPPGAGAPGMPGGMSGMPQMPTASAGVATGTVLPPGQAPAEFAATGRRRSADPFTPESYTAESYTQDSYAQESYSQGGYSGGEVSPSDAYKAPESYQPEPYQPEPVTPQPAPEEPARSNGVQGQIKIEDEVVEKIAALAALEVSGVAALGGAGRTSETMEAVRQRIGMSDRGEPRVRARVLDNEISVDIALIVEYGSVVMEVAKVVKSNVARIVGLMLGMRVASVNVTVEDVRMPDEQAAAQAAQGR
ncbi:Asp23/Gls24 family envelope stress response protein [Actinocorallia sp. A-T 12471]|uniref:Asp23/Gls24 family envelope stress response protein n=1 Tax=Actinocorallia sp. A-T 12471 TaxID=3089813 RepID=UPI0029CDFD02|nr:Asp23/Gls24 family envelope stress response protein [Actinocorallia sp. A-T 12471]MDX6740322.1 Asp23/Gls24 family envelope stress response protein [Actinocorallia sp. A-T 12471]